MCLRHGSYADKTFAVELIVCGNPLCDCKEITLRCVRTDRESAARPMRVDIKLDLQQRNVLLPASGKRSTAEGMSLAEELVNELEVGDWLDLYERFYEFKLAQTDSANCKNLTATFPPEVMRDPGLMVAYKEIFPWGNAFDFTLDRERWLFHDQYCVNPACDCQDATITLLRVAVTSDGRAEVAQEMPPAQYVVDRDMFQPLHPPWTDTPRLEALVDALRKTHPAIARGMRNRRLQLRTLYQTAVKRERPDMPPPPAQRRDMRPNDRCPCGSGLKFKKCCGKSA
jgi:hypothetical protein